MLCQNNIFIFVLIVLEEQCLPGIRIKFQESSLFVHQYFVSFLSIDLCVCNSQDETKVYLCVAHLYYYVRVYENY